MRNAPRAVLHAGLARVPANAVALPSDAPRLQVAATAIKMFAKPRWLTAHLIFIAAAGGMIWLGIWQLDVSNEKHFDLQNFGYAFQWWAFSAAALYLWFRLMGDSWRPPEVGAEERGVPLARVPKSGTTEGQDSPGLAVLGAAGVEPGQAPTIYRGYVIPSSADTLIRSVGDGYADSYNDYLWKLNEADEHKSGRRGTAAEAAPAQIVEQDIVELPPAEATEV